MSRARKKRSGSLLVILRRQGSSELINVNASQSVASVEEMLLLLEKGTMYRTTAATL